MNRVFKYAVVEPELKDHSRRLRVPKMVVPLQLLFSRYSGIEKLKAVDSLLRYRFESRCAHLVSLTGCQLLLLVCVFLIDGNHVGLFLVLLCQVHKLLRLAVVEHLRSSVLNEHTD
jgi:hypothetical protein